MDELLERYNKANKYFERTDISDTQKEQFLSSFQEILIGLNYYLQKIEIYSEQEVLEGFNG